MNAVLDAPALPLDRRGRPLRDLRLSVIEACNFRCGYCMPADRIPDDCGMDAASRLSFDEIETLVRGFARVGVHKLRLTGGEPLLRKRLPELVARLAAIDGIDDLEREYPHELLERCLFYHYAGVADGQALAGRGHRVATPGEVVALAEPTAEREQPA